MGGKHMADDRYDFDDLDEPDDLYGATEDGVFLFSRDFWRAAFARAVRTMAETAFATVIVSTRMEQVDWVAVLSTSALAGIASVLLAVSTGLPEAT